MIIIQPENDGAKPAATGGKGKVRLPSSDELLGIDNLKFMLKILPAVKRSETGAQRCGITPALEEELKTLNCLRRHSQFEFREVLSMTPFTESGVVI
jgi:hypothetical protein